MKTFRWTVPEPRLSAIELIEHQQKRSNREKATSSSDLVGETSESLAFLSLRDREYIRSFISGRRGLSKTSIAFIVLGMFYMLIYRESFKDLVEIKNLSYQEKQAMAYPSIHSIGSFFVGIVWVMIGVSRYGDLRIRRIANELVRHLDERADSKVAEEREK